MYLNEDFYEDFYEYVPDEVTIKINEIIKDELNSRLKFDIEELNRLRESDKNQQIKIYELQREIRQIQEEYDKKLKVTLLEKEREVQRKIFHDFTMNDKVYFLDYKYEHTLCTTCNNGKIKVIINEKEEEIKCPHCNGDGRNTKSKFFVKQGVISEVEFKTWYDESPQCTESYFWIKFTPGDNEKRKGEDIFKTEEEALQACELRNETYKR